MSALLDGIPADERERLVHAPAPDQPQAMKAVLSREAFDDPDWIYERKLDGVRCIAIRDGDRVRLLSRNEIDMGTRYPEVRDAIAAQAHEQFAIDGEIVAFAGRETSFARLVERGHHPVPVFLYVFDLVWFEGYDTRALPLRTRKRLLRSAVTYRGALRLTPHRNRHGVEMFKEACRKGWEGVVAKRGDSPYRATRSRDWLKFKCEAGQELVIGGYTAPRGSREEFGALLVGYFDDGKLRYAGKVGTGFDTDTLRSLGAQLRSLQRQTPAFADPESIRERHVTWVKPELVAQLGFTEWTRAGRLRHPRFLGLRDDKAAREVVRER